MDGDISDRSPQVLLHPDQPLVEGEQRLVNFKHVVISLLYEKLHDYIELAGVGRVKPALRSISCISERGSSNARAKAIAVVFDGL